MGAPPPSAEVQFLGGRRVHSVENICSSSGGVQVNIDPKPGNSPATSDHLKRSTSMHGHNNAKEYLGKTQPAKDSLAQLIADSTEKKFSFNNLFKGIWKKKQAQYTFGDM